jgi:hypothetical protein
MASVVVAVEMVVLGCLLFALLRRDDKRGKS